MTRNYGQAIRDARNMLSKLFQHALPLDECITDGKNSQPDGGGKIDPMTEEELKDWSDALLDRFAPAPADCPCCDNSGGYATPYMDNDGMMQAEETQCEWCWTVPNSKFNLGRT